MRPACFHAKVLPLDENRSLGNLEGWQEPDASQKTCLQAHYETPFLRDMGLGFALLREKRPQRYGGNPLCTAAAFVFPSAWDIPKGKDKSSS